ncbi:MAG: hypothetical protein ABMA14_02750 [Hyphomonadaceae bacterium]
MKIATLAVIASTLAAIAAPAFAQPTQEERAARFDAGDKDHDGKLTKAEFVAHLPEALKSKSEDMWAHYNPTKKNALTKAEYLAVPPMKVTVEVDQ